MIFWIAIFFDPQRTGAQPARVRRAVMAASVRPRFRCASIVPASAESDPALDTLTEPRQHQPTPTPGHRHDNRVDGTQSLVSISEAAALARKPGSHRQRRGAGPKQVRCSEALESRGLSLRPAVSAGRLRTDSERRSSPGSRATQTSPLASPQVPATSLPRRCRRTGALTDHRRPMRPRRRKGW